MAGPVRGGTVFTPLDTDQSPTSSSSAPDFAVGPQHVTAVVNSRLAVVERDGNVVTNQSFLEFFPDLQEPATAMELPGGDPQVVYDAHHDRFVVAVAEVKGHRTGTPSDDLAKVHFAVSEPGNPDGSWERSVLELETPDHPGGVFADLPKLAVARDAVYLAANANPFDTDAERDRLVWQIPTDDAGSLPDDPTAAARSVMPANASNSSAILPVSSRSGDTTVIVALERFGAGGPEKARITSLDGTQAGGHEGSTVVSLGDLTDSGRLPDVEQPGDGADLFTPNLFPTSGVLRDDVLTFAFTLPGTGVNQGQQTAHWAQVDLSDPDQPGLLDVGTVDGEAIAPGTHTFLPAVAVNGDGDVAVTFQASGSDLPPSMYAAVHAAGADDGSTSAPVALAEGTAAWGPPVGHWGDSADAAVDPRDDTTFWATNTIATGETAWAAPIARFTAEEPAAISQLPPSFGDRTIDALIATEEAGSVSQAERGDVAGTTAYKWGGPAGNGTSPTFSFPGPSTDFGPTYDDGRTADIRAPSDQFKASVRDALHQWGAIADVTFTEVPDGGDLRFTVTGSHPAFEAGKQRGEAFGPGPGPRAGDVWFSPAAAEQWDDALMLHEVGHPVFGFTDTSAAAGLGGATLAPEENFRTRTVMSYEGVPGHETGDPPGAARGNPDPWPTTPMVLDMRAAQAIYGANETYRTGDDVYSFDGDPVHRTIWDAGGEDRIDASGLETDARIDLRPGRYSDVGEAVQVNVPDGTTTLDATLGMADGTVIENAVGGDGADKLIGNAAGNTLRGGPGGDDLRGGAGDDVLHAGADGAADHLSGGPGRDEAVFAAVRGEAEISIRQDGVDVGLSGTTDTLSGIERIAFQDGKLALDPGAKSVYRLYEAAFDRDPDTEGLGYWIRQVDAGAALSDVAASFIASPEFERTYGTDLSAPEVVELLYENILGRQPDSAGRSYWIDELQQEESRAQVLAAFADSPENRSQLAAETEDGVWFV